MEGYYNIDSHGEIKNQLKKNENIIVLLGKIKPYLEEMFPDCEYCLHMNFEPETDDEFIFLRINVDSHHYNNGVRRDLIMFESKIRPIREELGVFRELSLMPGVINV